MPEIRQLQSMLNEKAPEAVSANYLFFAQEQRDYHASYERLKQENEAFKKEVEEKNGVILKLTLGTGAAVAFAGFLTYWGL
ncbi:MAG: hypothetical protein HRU31_14380 [Rhodobacteraceae bacterium]|nr:hypothetical protein [Paracoccaceae bacterium]